MHSSRRLRRSLWLTLKDASCSEFRNRPRRISSRLAIEEILCRVKGEFREMPGLRLTEAQARRLWGLDAVTCSALLGALTDAKFLLRTRDGAFLQAERHTAWSSR